MLLEGIPQRPQPCPCVRRVCIIAGNISPIDVVTPLPVLCEDNDVPYIYVPSKEVRASSPCAACC